MKIAIMGAGTLGKSLATAFCNDKDDVVLIDISSKTLRRVKDKLDVMTVNGDGAEVATLKSANIKSVELFIAVGNNDSQNIHACQIAKHFGVRSTICRLSSEDYFDSEAGLTPISIGIDHVVLPVDACVRKIYNVLDNQQTLEKIIFSVPDAMMAAFLVIPGSPMIGMRLKDFPDPEIIRSIRFSAILRKEKLIYPNGDTVIALNDEVYIAGHKINVKTMLDWASPKGKGIKKVVIAGGSIIGRKLAELLSSSGYDVRLIEEKSSNAEEILDDMNVKMMVINGDANDRDILDEAGVDGCDAFVAVQEDDEDNILSCILAKKLGCKKVIVLTNKEEYITLLPTMKMIDCGFSKWLVAVNSILRHISTINHTHTDALLHRAADAYVSEFEVHKGSSVCSCKIDECVLPESTVLSMVFRDNQVLAPAGDLVLLSGDLVAVIVTHKTEKVIEALFKGNKTKIKL